MTPMFCQHWYSADHYEIHRNCQHVHSLQLGQDPKVRDACSALFGYNVRNCVLRDTLPVLVGPALRFAPTDFGSAGHIFHLA